MAGRGNLLVTTRGRRRARPRGVRASRPAGGARGWRWPGRLAALALGTPLALAFPKPSLWWLAFVALVPLLLLVHGARDGREAGWRSWLGGTGFFLTVDSWLLPNARIFAIP